MRREHVSESVMGGLFGAFWMCGPATLYALRENMTGGVWWLIGGMAAFMFLFVFLVRRFD